MSLRRGGRVGEGRRAVRLLQPLQPAHQLHHLVVVLRLGEIRRRGGAAKRSGAGAVSIGAADPTPPATELPITIYICHKKNDAIGFLQSVDMWTR